MSRLSASKSIFAERGRVVEVRAERIGRRTVLMQQLDPQPVGIPVFRAWAACRMHHRLVSPPNGHLPVISLVSVLVLSFVCSFIEISLVKFQSLMRPPNRQIPINDPLGNRRSFNSLRRSFIVVLLLVPVVLLLVTNLGASLSYPL